MLTMVMDKLTEEIRQQSLWTMFMDDIVICCEKKEQVRDSAKRWRDSPESRQQAHLE